MNKPHTQCIGALFRNKVRAKATSPDLTGVIDIEPDVLRYLVEAHRTGKPRRLQLSAWKNCARKTSETYYTVVAQMPWRPQQDEDDNFIDDDSDPFL